MEMTQIRGADSTVRDTVCVVGAGGECIINEKLLTDGKQTAESNMEIILDGPGATGRVVSRSVAKGESVQLFRPCMTGKTKSFGHVQCDSIIMDSARIKSIPAIDAQDLDAQLIHEAAIGRIAGDQMLKLLALASPRRRPRRRSWRASSSKRAEHKEKGQAERLVPFYTSVRVNWNSVRPSSLVTRMLSLCSFRMVLTI